MKEVKALKVTIRKVAEVAGVSVSTVSKVINGHYSISEKTAQHVRKVMEDLNYYPNASAQSFATGDTKTIVLLASMGKPFRNQDRNQESEQFPCGTPRSGI